MTFKIQSIKDDWPEDMQGTFDLVHQRFVLAGAAPGSPQPVIPRLVTLLKPGGWLQLVEMDTETQPGWGPAMQLFGEVLRFMFDSIGLGAKFASQMNGWAEQAGLKNVQETVFQSPHGKMMAEEGLRQKSIDGPCSAITPILGVVKCKLTVDRMESDGWLLTDGSAAAPLQGGRLGRSRGPGA